MNIVEVVNNMSEDMYNRLKYAAETGRWPEGQEGTRRNRAMPGTRTALQHSTKSNSKTC